MLLQSQLQEQSFLQPVSPVFLPSALFSQALQAFQALLLQQGSQLPLPLSLQLQERLLFLSFGRLFFRTAEDLLFQVMLEKDIPLSSKIETEKVAGKTIFNVADGYLLACFDIGVTDDVVTAIAKKQPVHAVFRDAGMATDSTAINFDQIFENYSPDTKRSIL